MIRLLADSFFLSHTQSWHNGVKLVSFALAEAPFHIHRIKLLILCVNQHNFQLMIPVCTDKSSKSLRGAKFCWREIFVIGSLFLHLWRLSFSHLVYRNNFWFGRNLQKAILVHSAIFNLPTISHLTFRNVYQVWSPDKYWSKRSHWEEEEYEVLLPFGYEEPMGILLKPKQSVEASSLRSSRRVYFSSTFLVATVEKRIQHMKSCSGAGVNQLCIFITSELQLSER